MRRSSSHCHEELGSRRGAQHRVNVHGSGLTPSHRPARPPARRVTTRTPRPARRRSPAEPRMAVRRPAAAAQRRRRTVAAAGSMAADGRTAPGGGRALRARGCGIREEGEGSGEGYGGAAGTKICAERERDVTWPLPRGKAGAAGRHFVAGWCCMWGDMAMCRSRRQSSPQPTPSTLENSAAPHI